jgi:galactose mutarotase-like enzyme
LHVWNYKCGTQLRLEKKIPVPHLSDDVGAGTGRLNMFTKISNGQISVKVNHKGAELISLWNHALQLEYMWDANPAFWAKTSPVLFPIIGTLKNNAFVYDGQRYDLPRHGFARDYIFELEQKEDSKLVFLMKHSEHTLKVYPFEFDLRVIYTLEGFKLLVTYEVSNPADNKMYFSIGGHPAFKVPLIAGTTYEDYFLKFDQNEDSDQWLISKEGLIEQISAALFAGENVLPLTHELFYKDALVFKDLKSSVISIRSHKHTHGLDFSFPGFPYFGIWAFKDADFVCLEPWCGIADSVDHDQLVEHKEGIVELAGEGKWARTWAVKCY